MMFPRKREVPPPLVLDLAGDGVPVTVTCRVLGFSTQAFYKWKKQPVTQRDWDDAHLIHAARTIHDDDPAFGYRFIADELSDHGITAGENRVARLCSQERIWSVFAKKKGLTRKAGPPVHDDLVDRQFTAHEPDRLWLTFRHRAPHRRRQAVPLRHQGHVVEQDRRLLHGLTYEGLVGGVRTEQRCGTTWLGGDDCSLGPG
jgi:hypothetical protein